MCPWPVLVMTYTGGATPEDKWANLAVGIPARKDLPPFLFISPGCIPCQIYQLYDIFGLFIIWPDKICKQQKTKTIKDKDKDKIKTRGKKELGGPHFPFVVKVFKNCPMIRKLFQQIAQLFRDIIEKGLSLYCRVPKLNIEIIIIYRNRNAVFSPFSK